MLPETGVADGDRTERKRTVVATMLAGVPDQGGWVWAVMQWVLGLDALGHDVFVIEPVERLEPAVVERFVRLADAFGLSGRAALVTPAGEAAPVAYRSVVDRCAASDVLLNLGGALRQPELLDAAPARVFVDVDPGFTQWWHLDGMDTGLDRHTAHVTVGLNVGSDGCQVPTCGRAWVTTAPPVALHRWPVSGRVIYPGLTTVANWRGYGPVTHDGVFYGQKAHSWRTLMPIADRTLVACTPALAIHPAERDDLAALGEHGWRILDPVIHAGSPGAYHRFVSGSFAELNVAKSGFVASGSGWFSDRSACYLAAGRPVVAQETGFSGHLPVGEGLLAFDDVDSAVEAVQRVRRDYGQHRRAARRIALENLDSRKVLRRLLPLVMEGGR